MKYELGNLMAENTDTESLVLLGYRIDRMRKEMDDLLNENDELTPTGICLTTGKLSLRCA